MTQSTVAVTDLIVQADDIEAYSLPGDEAVYHSQCLIDRDGVRSTTLSMNRFTLKAGQHLHGLAHPIGADECYYVIRGRARLTMGGDPKTGEGAEVQEIGPDTAIFIPGGTFHAIQNLSETEEFVILTIWPRLPEPGSNPIYDGRRKAWGTSFRRKSTA